MWLFVASLAKRRPLLYIVVYALREVVYTRLLFHLEIQLISVSSHTTSRAQNFSRDTPDFIRITDQKSRGGI